MNAAIESRLNDVRSSGAHLADTIPAARPFVAAVNIALDVLAESVAPVPEADRPPFTRAEAARYLSISKTTLDVLRRDGKLKACGENGLPSASGHRRQVRFAKAELDRFLGGTI